MSLPDRTAQGEWLVAQLPLALQREQLVAALVTAAQQVVDPVRGQLDALDALLDPGTAPPEMLGFLASWFGFTLDSGDDEEMLRSLVARLGPIVVRRGTVGALRELAELLTRGSVRITENGGVWVAGAKAPAADGRVRVHVAQAGPLGEQRVRAILLREIPVGVELELVVEHG